MSAVKRLFVAIQNKVGTEVGVTDDNRLKVEAAMVSGGDESGSTQRTAGIERNVNTTGTVAAGAYNVSFFNAGDDDCTVKTVTLKAGEVVTFEAGGESNTLDAIAWEADTSAASEILITKVT